MTFLEFLISVFAVCLTAFCSGSETAFSAASRLKTFHRLRRHSGGANLTSRILNRPGLYLTTTLVGTNIGMVVVSSISARAGNNLKNELSELLLVVGTALFLLVFAEVIPKQLFLRNSDRIVDRLSPVLLRLRMVLFPFIAIADGISSLLVGDRAVPRLFESREEIRSFLVSSNAPGSDLIDRGLRFGMSTAWHLSKILSTFSSLRVNMTRKVILSELNRKRSAFYLVYESDGETLRGYVRLSEITRQKGPWHLSNLVEALPYFDRKTLLAEVLTDLHRLDAPVGTVLGPTGQAEGIVTFTDVLDELLGETDTIQLSRKPLKIAWNREAVIPVSTRENSVETGLP